MTTQFSRHGFTAISIAMLALAAIPRIHADTVFFADGFDRANSLNLDAVTNGMSGALIAAGTLGPDGVWLEPDDVYYANDNDAQVTVNQLKLGGNGHSVHAVLNQDLAGVFSRGVVTFSLTLTNGAPTGSTPAQRYSGFGMAFTLAEGKVSADRQLTRVADLYVAETQDGQIRVNDENPALRPTGTVDIPPTATLDLNPGAATFINGVLSVTLTITNTAAGSTVPYTIAFAAAGFTTNFTGRSFVLSDNNEFYAGVEERSASAMTNDNFVIAATTYSPPPVFSLAWRATTDNVWDAGTINWVDAGLGLDGYAFFDGANVTFNDATANASVSVPGSVAPGGMSFNNASSNYTFSGAGSITGAASLTKVGNGTLTISLNNTFSGGTTLSAGRLRLGSDTALGSGLVTLNGGTISSDSGAARTLVNGLKINGAGTFGDGADAGRLTFGGLLDFNGAGRNLTVNGDSTVVFAGGAANGSPASKQGSGTAVIKGGGEFVGVVDVQDGTLIFDGATVHSTDRIISDTYNFNGLARLVITNGASITISNSLGNLRSGRRASAGSNYVDLAGLYSLPNADAADGFITLEGDAAYAEVTLWPGGDFTARGVTNNAGSGNTVFKFNGGILRARNDNDRFFGGLAQTIVQSGGAIMDDNGYAITVSQDLLDGGGGLTKLGTGALTLAGNNAYTGGTTVSNGTLRVNGSLAGGGGVVVKSTATLAGAGVITGPVLIEAGGTLSPGTVAGAPTTLTIQGDLTLAGDLAVQVNKTLSPSNNLIVVNGALNNAGNGNLLINNAGALAAGDSFKLFNQPLVNGNLLTFSPSVPGGGLAWTNRLAVDGTIGVVAGPANGTPADLTGLTLSAGTLAPAFNSNFLAYAASAAYTNATVCLVPTSADPAATIRVVCNGVTNRVASGAASAPVLLKPGTNAIDVQVTAPDHSLTKDYVIVFTRTRPNVIVILADDQGFSDWGCYGSEISTPNLDQLAAEGLRYRQFYNCARCSPTRCAILTGLYTAQVAVDPYAALPNLRNDNNVTIAELLGANGYRTYMSGKWHLGGGTYLPEGRGFDQVFRYVNGNDHSEDTWNTNRYALVSSNGEVTNRIYGAGQFYQPDAIGDYSLDFINNDLVTHDDGKPFFLYMAFGSAHFPIQAPKDWVDTNNPVYAQGWDYVRHWRYTNMLARGVIDPHYGLSPNDGTPPWSSVPAEVILPWNSLSADRQADLARRMAIYAAMIQKMDQNIGRVVRRLKELGQLDNTLIFAVSDNGGNYEGGVYGLTGSTSDAPPVTGAGLDNMGLSGQPTIYLGGGWAHVSNTPFRLFKHFNHGGGVRTPLIVHWPQGVTRTNEWEEQVGHVMDIMATIVDVTGVSYPTQFNNHVVLPLEGVSLKPSFAAGNEVPRTIAFEHESNRAWISGSWKLVTKNYDLVTGTSPANELELYDLSRDGSEMTNLATSQPVRLQQMVTNWNAWATRVGLASRLVNTNVFALPVTPATNTGDLFVDTFNRPNDTNVDAGSEGMWGTRVPPLGTDAAYYEGYEGSGDPTSIEIVNSNLEMAVGFGMSENGIMHNFVGPDIAAAGGFSVELNVQEINSDTSDAANRYVGFGVGLSQAEAAAGGDVSDATGTLFRGKAGNANLGVADFFVELDINGNVKVWSDGGLLDTVPVGQNYGVLTASFACAGFTTNDPVTVTVFFNGRPVDINTADANSTSRTFKWDRNDSNYIGLSARASNYTRLDNLAIRKLPLSSGLAVGYALAHGLSGTDAAAGADPDGDGVSNFGEWAFGGDPTAYDPMIASLKGVVITPTNDFQFDYQRLINAAGYGLRYRYFTSGDLATWTEVTPVQVNATSNEDLPGYEIVTLQLPAAAITGKDKLFLRVLAEPGN